MQDICPSRARRATGHVRHAPTRVGMRQPVCRPAATGNWLGRWRTGGGARIPRADANGSAVFIGMHRSPHCSRVLGYAWDTGSGGGGGVGGMCALIVRSIFTG